MTALDQHIIFQLDSLSEDGKEHARKILGTSKKKKINKSNKIAMDKMFKALFTK